MTGVQGERELRIKITERTLWEQSDSITKNNIRIMDIPKGEERKKKTKVI